MNVFFFYSYSNSTSCLIFIILFISNSFVSFVVLFLSVYLLTELIYIDCNYVLDGLMVDLLYGLKVLIEKLDGSCFIFVLSMMLLFNSSILLSIIYF